MVCKAYRYGPVTQVYIRIHTRRRDSCIASVSLPPSRVDQFPTLEDFILPLSLYIGSIKPASGAERSCSAYSRASTNDRHHTPSWMSCFICPCHVLLDRNIMPYISHHIYRTYTHGSDNSRDISIYVWKSH